jgi:hypothetical protein
MPLESPKCGTLLTSHATSCPRCAAVVSHKSAGSSVADATIESELAKMDRELKESMEKMNRELEQSLGQMQSPPTAGGRVTQPEDYRFPSNQATDQNRMHFASAAKEPVSDGPGDKYHLLSPREMDGFLLPLPTRVASTLSAVLHCPHVLGNLHYRLKASQVQFHFDPSDNRVNAYAAAARTKEDAVHPDASLIIYLTGLANIIRVTAACVADHHRLIQKNRYADPRHFKDCIRTIGERMENNGGLFANTDTLHLTNTLLFPDGIKDETIVTYAQNYTEAMERFIFAHELGHICYGHVLGARDNYDISRMQERDADSFAAQCSSSDTHRETSFLGQLFVTLIFAWCEERLPNAPQTTHPAGRERYLNAINSNPTPAMEALDTLNLTVDDLHALLP